MEASESGEPTLSRNSSTKRRTVLISWSRENSTISSRIRSVKYWRRQRQGIVRVVHQAGFREPATSHQALQRGGRGSALLFAPLAYRNRVQTKSQIAPGQESLLRARAPQP